MGLLRKSGLQNIKILVQRFAGSTQRTASPRALISTNRINLCPSKRRPICGRPNGLGKRRLPFTPLLPLACDSEHPTPPHRANGVWSLATKLHPDILALASQRPAIIADENILRPTQSAFKTGLRVPHLTVSRNRKTPQFLEVDIQMK